MTRNPPEPEGDIEAQVLGEQLRAAGIDDAALYRDLELARVTGRVSDELRRRAAEATQGTPPLSECITVFISDDQCGKVYTRDSDGKVKKESIGHITNAVASTVHVPDAKTFAEVLLWVMDTPNAGLILGAVKGTKPRDEFQIRTMKTLHELLRKPDRADIAGIHQIDGSACIARMKENFAPCQWALLDRDVDEHTPGQFDADSLPYDDWLRLVDEKLLPGVASCERVVLPSSSARVRLPDGTPYSSGNGHTFVRTNGGDLERVRSQLSAKAALEGIAWPKPRFSRKTGEKMGESATTILDASVLSPGRLTFDGKPRASNGLSIAPPEVAVFDGPALDLSAFVDLTDEEIAIRNAASPVRLHRDGAGRVSQQDHTTLTLDTVIELEDGETMSVREWHESGRGHTRIQSPFRASDSFAAFIDRDPLRVYDSGTCTTYHCAAPKPDPGKVFDDLLPERGDQTEAASASSTPSRPEPFPGPMSEIVAAMLATAPKPRKGLAVVAALMGMAAACDGRLHLAADGHSRLNLFATVLLETGEGKEHAMKVSEAVARAAGAQVAGKPASGAALEDMLQDHGSMLLTIDEAGHLLAAMNARHAPTYLTDLSSVMMQLHSRGPSTYHTRGRAASGKKESAAGRAVAHPAVSALMFSTPQKFAHVAGVMDIESGALGRHLFYIDTERVEQRRVGGAFNLPASVVEVARQIRAMGAFPATEPSSPFEAPPLAAHREVDIAYGDGTEALLQRVMDRFSSRQRQPAVSSLEGMLTARGYENLLRVAGTLAVWDAPHRPTLRPDQVAWAEAFVLRSIHDAVLFADEHMHEAGVLADAAHVLRVCRRVLAGELKCDRLNEFACVRRGVVPRRIALKHSRLAKEPFAKALEHLDAVGDAHAFDAPLLQDGGTVPAIKVLRAG
ncbi:hypothetical protein [Variovorax rhizosphaerae]|uniref:DUF3987 domain-containing protein n=1 Tax=Variovorax rhizosphaerae TaxID=1836200 RepID=A0ABU8WSC9_9BURK